MRSTLLDHVADEDRRALLTISARRRYRRGEVVFHQGDLGDTLHVVLAGIFLVQIEAQYRGEVIARIARAGDIFGELALLVPGRRRAATVIALEPGETRCIDVATFDALRARNPAVDRFLAEALAERLQEMSDLLIEAYFHPVAQRVHRRVLDLQRGIRDGVPGDWIRINQRELAALSGTTRATVNRVLQRAVDAGLVELGRGRLRVVDEPRLRHAAGAR